MILNLVFRFIFKIYILYVFLIQYVNSLPNKRFHFSSICGNEKLYTLPKLIDGAVVTSSREENLNCIITFQTESVLQKFMLRFENLRLDCNDHLFIYDGENAVGNPKADLSCRSTKDEVGTIFINGYYVTLKYVTDSWSKQGDGFSMIITAYKDTRFSNCNLFTCANSFCISPDLTCDNVDHCKDNSDETNYAFCSTVLENEMGVIFGLEASAFLSIVIVLFLICLFCVISVALCLFKSEQRFRSDTQISRMNLLQGTPILAHPVSYTGTLSNYNTSNQRFATLPLEKLPRKPVSYSGTTQQYASVTNNNLSMSTLNNLNIQNNQLPLQHVVYYTRK